MAWRSSLLAVVMAGAATLFAGTALATPMPGMEVSDENSSCTAGFAAQRGNGQYYLLTSGHCDGQDFSPWTDAAGNPIGRIMASEDNGDDRDAAMIELNSAAGVPIGDVDGRYRIRDVLTADQMHVGMPFCKVGARTGETCGTVTGITGNVVTTNLFSLEGDSGSPGFVMNPDGTVSAVGILQGGPGGDDNTTDFVMIDPLLRQWGLRLLL